MNPLRPNATALTRPSDPEKQWVEFLRNEREYDQEAFNRVNYAKELLRMLKVRRRVAICVGTERLRFERGGLPGAPEQKPWAILSIPPDASRAHIALTILQLADRSSDPFLLDLMLRVRPA
ncbi:MAG: hypothetical protein RMJ98_16770 [Myxococcales bacterium]|nr:hypothetical protein [Polyangiaceae bacterium]MDW8250949.1 hypothetical protein [Myxococcales bacterium]